MLRGTPWLVAVLLAATAAPGPPTRRPAASQPAPRNQPALRLSDAELEKAIRERFARSKIAADGFSVRVQGGVATLEGRTNVIQHKGTATRLAKAAGARQVINRIEVSPEARQKAAANLTQGRRRAQIKRGENVPRSERR